MGGILERLRTGAAWVRERIGAQLSLVWIFAPIVLIALVIAGYGWWWRVVAEEVRDQIGAFQTAQRDAGRELSWDSLTTEGFPYRVQTTAGAVRFMAPDRGTAWDSERIVVQVQPLSLGQVDVSLEGQQHFFYARERWIETDARADKALVTIKGSGSAAQHIALDIERLTGKAKLDATEFNFIVDDAQGRLAVSEAGAADELPRVELTARLANVALQGNLDLALGPAIALIDIDAAAKMPANLPEASAATLFAEWRRTGTPVEIRRFQLEWGGISVDASGEFKIDAQSLPDGRFNLKLGNHPRILELLEAHGWINAETRALTKRVLDVLAFMSGDAQRRVSVPMRIHEGAVYLGPAKVATLAPQPVVAQPSLPADAAPPTP